MKMTNNNAKSEETAALVATGRLTAVPAAGNHKCRGKAKPLRGKLFGSLLLCMAFAIQAQCAEKSAAGTSGGVISKAEIWSELKFRRAVPETQEAPRSSDFLLYKAMKRAEEENAFDFLQKRRKDIPSVFYVERKSAEGPEKLLTLQGFQDYRDRLTRDAVKFFQNKGLGWPEIMKLRDLRGAAVMGDFGLLSYAGMEVYYAALKGRHEWLMPGEKIPESSLTPEEKQAADLLKRGYIELSDSEYNWLLKVTRCSETTLRVDYKILTIKRGKAGNRYFAEKAEMNETNVIHFYIYKYRHGDTNDPAMKSTAFFGSGAVTGRRLCGNDGKPWLGQ
ncbi:MAG: hypothetical protein NTX59_12610 [Elusimicrobia bacterium]|nr:hypothetical protein [Elusimicrobiota bacterium]